MTPGQRIVSRRKRHHLTQRQLAEILGVSQATISRWERDKLGPDYAAALILQRALGGTIRDYLT